MDQWKQLAAKLAQMGLPVLGRTIGALVGSQVPIFGGMIAGAGENIGSAAAAMVAHALGVEPTAEAINTAIESQPTSEVMARLQAAESEAAVKWPAIAAIVQSMSDEYKAALQDNEAARTQTLKLVEAASPLAWGPVVLSVLVVIAFVVILSIWLVIPPTFDPQSITIFTLLVGSLSTAFGQVVAYWLGSSASSKDKDNALKVALIGSTQQQSAPMPTPNKPTARTAARG
jgi:hypothetical protein